MEKSPSSTRRAASARASTGFSNFFTWRLVNRRLNRTMTTMAAAPLRSMDSTAISPGGRLLPRKSAVGGREKAMTVYPSRSTPTMVPEGF